MSTKNTQVRVQLLQAGLIEEAAPEPGKLESPWYVKVLLAFSGWLAALLLLCFIGIGFDLIIENSTAMLITGGMMIGGAFALLRISKNEFVEHLALAVSLAGQALVVFALFDSSDLDSITVWLLVALMQISLALVMPNFVHRVFSSFIAALAFNLVLSFWGLHYAVDGLVMLMAAVCWLYEFSHPQQMKVKQAIGYGLLLALLIFKGTMLYGFHRVIDWIDWWGGQFVPHRLELLDKPWLDEIITGMVVLYVVWQILQRYGQPVAERISVTALLGTVLLCVVSVKVQGITVGMVILLLGFAGANRVLLGLGIMSLLFYISFYYYLLDATLLAKSQTLLTVGLVLLLIRWLMLTIIPVNREADHV
jgi:uncharacterized membrane protein